MRGSPPGERIDCISDSSDDSGNRSKCEGNEEAYIDVSFPPVVVIRVLLIRRSAESVSTLHAGI